MKNNSINDVTFVEVVINNGSQELRMSFYGSCKTELMNTLNKNNVQTMTIFLQ